MVVQRKARLPEEEGFIEEPATMATGGDTEEVKKNAGGLLGGEQQVQTQRSGCKKGVNEERCIALSHPWRSWRGDFSVMRILTLFCHGLIDGTSHSESLNLRCPRYKRITEGSRYDSGCEIFDT